MCIRSVSLLVVHVPLLVCICALQPRGAHGGRVPASSRCPELWREHDHASPIVQRRPVERSSDLRTLGSNVEFNVFMFHSCCATQQGLSALSARGRRESTPAGAGRRETRDDATSAPGAGRREPSHTSPASSGVLFVILCADCCDVLQKLQPWVRHFLTLFV